MDARGVINSNGFVAWFSELTLKNADIVGKQGAYLAEMYNTKIPVPPGFVITKKAYQFFIEKSGLGKQIKNILEETNLEDSKVLERDSKKIREMIENVEMPKELLELILESYDVLDVDKKNFLKATQGALDILRNSHEPLFVAVKNSPIIPKDIDEKDISFAGQSESFLNIKGNYQLIKSVKKSFAQIFTPSSIFYRKNKGIPYEDFCSGIIVQKMVDANKSGVIFSKNPLNNDGNIIIEAVWGLGKGISYGVISPDYYAISPELKFVEQKIIRRNRNHKIK